MKKACILLADGFEEIEALTVVDVLRRANIVCDICSIDKIEVKGSHNIKVFGDLTIDKLNFDDYDAVILPGGMPGAANLRDNEKVIRIIKQFNKNNKTIGAICAAPIVLNRADIIKDKKITSYPGVKDQLLDCVYKEDKVVVDGNLITSRGPATALQFALELVGILKDKETMNKLKEAMLVTL